MGLRQLAAKGVLWSGIQNVCSTLIGVVVFLVLACLLEPGAFGLLGMASACIAIAEIFLKQGLAQAIVQRAELHPGHLDTAFWMSVVVGVVLTALGLSGAGIVADLLNEARLAPVLRWLSLGFVIGAFGNTHLAILQRQMAFKSLAFRSLLAVGVSGVVGIGMALAGCGVWSLVGQNLTMLVVGSAVLWAASDWRPGCGVSTRHFKDLIGFGGSVMGVEAMTVVNGRATDLLIGIFLGAQSLGYYHMGSKLFMLITHMLTQTLSAVALPTFSRLQHDLTQMRNAFATATQISCLIGFPAFLGLAVIAPELIDGVLGAKWGRSLPVMQILAFAGLLQAAFYFNRPAIMAAGKPAWVLKLAFLNAVTNILLVLLVVRWGIIAVAVAFTLRGYGFAPVLLWMTRRAIHMEPAAVLRQYLAPATASLVMVLVVLGARLLLAGSMGPRPLLVLCVLLGAVVYTGIIRLAAPTLMQKVRDLVRLALRPPE